MHLTIEGVNITAQHNAEDRSKLALSEFASSSQRRRASLLYVLYWVSCQLRSHLFELQAKSACSSQDQQRLSRHHET